MDHVMMFCMTVMHRMRHMMKNGMTTGFRLSVVTCIRMSSQPGTVVLRLCEWRERQDKSSNAK